MTAPLPAQVPARPRRRSRLLTLALGAALALTPLVSVATSATPAAATTAQCAGMDVPVHLATDPANGRTLLSTYRSEITSAAKFGFSQDKGVAFLASRTAKPGLKPVYRMYQSFSGTFLWTMSETERATAEERYGFRTQQIDFYASPTWLDCAAGVQRFDQHQAGAMRYALTAAPQQVAEYESAGWAGGAVNFFAGPVTGTGGTSTSGGGQSAPKPAPSPEPAPTTAPSPAPTTAPVSTRPASPTSPQAGPTSVVTAGDVGAAPIGSADYGLPSGALYVSPSGSDNNSGTRQWPVRTLEQAVRNVKAGQTIVLRGGVYNAQAKFFVDRVTIQNYPGEEVWLDGSLPVTGFTRNSAGDYQARWTYEFNAAVSFTGEAGSGHWAFVSEHNKMAAWPDQVFIDGRQLWQVEKNPGRGEFARDYVNDLVILGEDPAGREVRASSKEQALFIGGADVTLQGIGIRRYASGLRSLGTVYVMAGGLTVRDVVLEDSASTALNIAQLGRGSAAHVTDTTIVRAGMVGIAANGMDKGLIERTHIVDANWAGFNAAPNAAGMKISRTQDIMVRDNVVSGTGSSGIWFDESVAGFRALGNRVTGGTSWGIMAELSGHGVIANNWLVGNGNGLNLFDVNNVEVVNNMVDDVDNVVIIVHQDARRHANPRDPGHDPRFAAGTDPRVTWYVKDVTVRNNVFGSTSPEPWFALQVRDTSRERTASQMGVTFQGNAFVPRTGTKPLVGWGDNKGDFTHYRTLDAWQSAQSSLASNNRTVADSSAGELDAWAAANLPVVPWPSTALNVLGLNSSPGYQPLR